METNREALALEMFDLIEAGKSKLKSTMADEEKQLLDDLLSLQEWAVNVANGKRANIDRGIQLTENVKKALSKSD